MPARHHEHMAPRRRADVHERHGALVLPDDRARQLAGEDLAEDAVGIAVGHGGEAYPARRGAPPGTRRSVLHRCARLPVPDVEPESKVCPMSRSTSAAFESLWGGFAEGRLAHPLRLLDPECEVVLLDGRRVRGHDGVRAWLGDLYRDWSTLTMVCDEIHEAGPDCVVAVGRVTGTSA